MTIIVIVRSHPRIKVHITAKTDRKIRWEWLRTAEISFSIKSVLYQDSIKSLRRFSITFMRLTLHSGILQLSPYHVIHNNGENYNTKWGYPPQFFPTTMINLRWTAYDISVKWLVMSDKISDYYYRPFFEVDKGEWILKRCIGNNGYDMTLNRFRYATIDAVNLPSE